MCNIYLPSSELHSYSCIHMSLLKIYLSSSSHMSLTIFFKVPTFRQAQIIKGESDEKLKFPRNQCPLFNFTGNQKPIIDFQICLGTWPSKSQDNALLEIGGYYYRSRAKPLKPIIKHLNCGVDKLKLIDCRAPLHSSIPWSNLSTVHSLCSLGPK